MVVYLSAFSGRDLQKAVEQRLLFDVPAVPGETVVEVTNDGADVTLP